jgi:hypothetical protein
MSQWKTETTACLVVVRVGPSPPMIYARGCGSVIDRNSHFRRRESGLRDTFQQIDAERFVSMPTRPDSPSIGLPL